MTIADMVYTQVKLLPDPLAREVLDFVGFLREGRDRRMARSDESTGERTCRGVGQSGRQSLGRCLSEKICCSMARIDRGVRRRLMRE
jgi:hypothetical protein